VFRDACEERVAGDNALHASCCKSVKVAAEINLFVTCEPYEKWSGVVFAHIQIALQPVSRFSTNKHWPILLSFAAYRKLTTLQVDMLPIKVDEFTHT
jgi:hypothetical protein